MRVSIRFYSAEIMIRVKHSIKDGITEVDTYGMY